MTDKLLPGFRDAIHVPYVVVTCNETAPSGAKAWFDSGSCNYDDRPRECRLWRPSTEYDPQPDWHGVVDPFIEDETIAPGTPFRLLIRAECFSRLRHDFEIEVHDRGGTATCHSVCDVR